VLSNFISVDYITIKRILISRFFGEIQYRSITTMNILFGDWLASMIAVSHS